MGPSGPPCQSGIRNLQLQLHFEDGWKSTEIIIGHTAETQREPAEPGGSERFCRPQRLGNKAIAHRQHSLCNPNLRQPWPFLLNLVPYFQQRGRAKQGEYSASYSVLDLQCKPSHLVFLHGLRNWCKTFLTAQICCPVTLIWQPHVGLMLNSLTYILRDLCFFLNVSLYCPLVLM